MEKFNYLLGHENLKIYQNSDMFNFSIDSILLPNFVTLNNKIKKILDIGTGNAVIPILLTTKTKALIDAVEIQKDVFELGEKSIKYNKLECQIKIYNQDIKEYYKNIESDTYNTITCNPPFFKIIKTNRVNEKEYKTIARHEIKLNLEDIMIISKKLLKNNGNLAIVHRTDRLIDIIELMRKYNIEPKRIRLVYPKENTDSNIILIEGTKNGKPGLKILKPLICHDEFDNYSSEIKQYFNN